MSKGIRVLRDYQLAGIKAVQKSIEAGKLPPKSPFNKHILSFPPIEIV